MNKITTFRCALALALAFILGILFSMRDASAAIQNIDALKAAYIYNIAKFTRWPIATLPSDNSTFNLCVYSKKTIDHSLLRLENKKINHHPIKVIKAEKGISFTQCHALYIVEATTPRYRYLLTLINPEKTLTISADDAFLRRGGLINLNHSSQRLRFEVNMQQLKNSQLTLSSKLLKLAILIDTPR